MILDDGGDATMLVHKGAEAEKAGEVPEPSTEDSAEWHVFLELIRRTLADGGPGSRSRMPSRASPRRPPPEYTACTR